MKHSPLAFLVAIVAVVGASSEKKEDEVCIQTSTSTTTTTTVYPVLVSGAHRFPVGNNETVLLQGSGLATATTMLCNTQMQDCVVVPSLATEDYAIAATLPLSSSWAVNIAFLQACTDSTGTVCSSAVYINAPIVDWFIGDASAGDNGTVIAGETLHILGSNLAYVVNGACTPLLAPTNPQDYLDLEAAVETLISLSRRGAEKLKHGVDDGILASMQSLHHTSAALHEASIAKPTSINTSASSSSSSSSSPQVYLENTTGQMFPLIVTLSSCHRIDAIVPSTLAPGTYHLYIDNGLPTGTFPTGLSTQVVLPPVPPSTTFTVGTSPGCDTVIACVATAAAGGGGSIVVVPSGTYQMGPNEILNISNGIQLVGGAAGSPDYLQMPTLLWSANTAPAPDHLITCNGNGGLISGFNLVSTSPTNNFVHFTGIIEEGSSSSSSSSSSATASSTTGGCSFVGNSLVLNYTNPSAPIRNAILVDNGAVSWRITGNTLFHGGNCSSSWPYNCAFSLHASRYGIFTNNTVYSDCQGYAGDSLHSFFWDANTLISIGTDSQGQGFNTFSSPLVLQHLYFGRSIDVGNPEAEKRWESMTLDGPGSIAFSRVQTATINGELQTLTLQDLPYTVSMTTIGSLVAVMQGPGVGQTRQVYAYNVTGNDPSTYFWTVSPPFDTPLVPGESVLSILPFRGDVIFEGNTWLNGTTFQYFGVCVRCVTAGNYAQEMPNILSWGRMYQGGFQPNFEMLYASNTMRCAGGEISSITNTEATPIPPFNFTGPFNGFQTFRNNVLVAGANMKMSGATWATVVENNVFTSGQCNSTGPVVAAGALSVSNATVQMVVVR